MSLNCRSPIKPFSIALWDKGLFGLNYPYQSSGKYSLVGYDDQTLTHLPLSLDSANVQWNQNAPVNPLRESDALTKDQWFAHGYKGFPPAAGDMLTLPSGSTYHGTIDPPPVPHYYIVADRMVPVLTGEVACNRAQTHLRNPSITDAYFEYACSVSVPFCRLTASQ